MALHSPLVRVDREDTAGDNTQPRAARGAARRTGAGRRAPAERRWTGIRRPPHRGPNREHVRAVGPPAAEEVPECATAPGLADAGADDPRRAGAAVLLLHPDPRQRHRLP